MRRTKALLIAGLFALVCTNVLAAPAAPLPKPKPPEPETVEFTKKGVIIRPSSDVQLRIYGFVQWDVRNYLGDTVTTTGDEWKTRRLRPSLELKLFGDMLTYVLTPDFAGPVTRFVYNYLNIKFDDNVQMRIGKMKAPLGLEALQSDELMPTLERSYPTNFSNSRDVGVMLHGNLFNKMMEYQAAVMYGTPDTGQNDGNGDSNYDYYLRVFANPWKEDTGVLGCLGVGAAASFGRHEGTTTRRMLPTYRTLGQQRLFGYSSSAFADGNKWRFIPQANCYYKNFGVSGEYALTSEELTRSSSHDTFTNTAWQITANYVLTGEPAKFKGVDPAWTLDPANGNYGAVELVGRVGGIDMDNDAFPTFATITTSATSANNAGLGVNWYPTSNTRVGVSYDYTTFTGGATTGDLEDEHFLLTRFQVKF